MKSNFWWIAVGIFIVGIFVFSYYVEDPLARTIYCVPAAGIILIVSLTIVANRVKSKTRKKFEGQAVRYLPEGFRLRTLFQESDDEFFYLRLEPVLEQSVRYCELPKKRLLDRNNEPLAKFPKEFIAEGITTGEERLYRIITIVE